MLKYFAYKYIQNNPEAAINVAARQLANDEPRARKVIQGLIDRCLSKKSHISKNPKRTKKESPATGVSGRFID